MIDFLTSTLKRIIETITYAFQYGMICCCIHLEEKCTDGNKTPTEEELNSNNQTNYGSIDTNNTNTNNDSQKIRKGSNASNHPVLEALQNKMVEKIERQ